VVILTEMYCLSGGNLCMHMRVHTHTHTHTHTLTLSHILLTQD